MNISTMNRTSGLKPLSSLCGDQGDTFCHVAFWVWKTVPFGLLAFSTAGNILSLLVLSRKKMQKKPSSLYLICLAVADLVFLWTSLVRNTLLRIINVDLKVISIFNCKVHEWLAVWSLGLSIWMLVLLTMERFVATVFPLFARRHVTRTPAIVTMVSAIVGTGLTASHFIGHTLQRRILEITDENGNQTSIVQTVCGASSIEYNNFLSGPWTYMKVFMYSVIPFLIILIGNCAIACKVVLRRRNIQPLGQNQKNRMSSLTKMLFILSGFFCITTTPYALFGFFFSRRHSSLSAQDFAAFQLGHAIAFMLLFSNSTFNFVLYCMNGSIFRNELKALFQDMKLGMSKLFRNNEAQ